MSSRATILGDGQMALVLAEVLDQNGFAVTVWSPTEESGRALAGDRSAHRLPGYQVPPSITLTTDSELAIGDASVVASAIPTPFLRATIGRLAGALAARRASGNFLVASATKGIECVTGRRPSQIWHECASIDPVVVSGPNIATELIRECPAAMVASHREGACAEAMQRCLSRPWLRVYTNDDPIGVELCGALKNVVALAAGMLDGLGAGYNAKSMLLARGLAEMRRFGLACGARDETFMGLAGVGDLATTCFCPDGRNRTTGEALARGEPLERVLSRSTSVIEGVPTARAVVEQGRALGIEMPIASAVEGVCAGRLTPREALVMLMERNARGE
ncbi:MAG: NAD(P)-dependent glycerol-3-phosphate dehydrogenase [Planctomycetota bacterium]|nr:NAD(P)-dependent glycerol-3-phosphate dehydrogenase [Planctomycetota bacterium]MDA1104967.1 NAD(P)-dependent glycerol-3-phosphate dehydrogenase [Planctomycetota bacterium]